MRIARKMEEAVDNAAEVEEHMTSESESLRTGQWTLEEEAYAGKLIELFDQGYTNIGSSDGQSLRSFLSEKLNCNRMRISKKFAAYDGLSKHFVGVAHSKQSQHQVKVMLAGLHSAFQAKDLVVQSNRIKRKKYYVKGSPTSEINKVLKVEEVAYVSSTATSVERVDDTINDITRNTSI